MVCWLGLLVKEVGGERIAEYDGESEVDRGVVRD